MIIACRPRFDLFGPAGDKGNADTAFIQVALYATQGSAAIKK